MSERDASENNLEWAIIMEECKRELLCVCHKIESAVRYLSLGDDDMAAWNEDKGDDLFEYSNFHEKEAT